jgi:large subunit ribosomal protein L14
MVQVETYLKVADNSGAITVCCIKVQKRSVRNGASAGETITVVVKKNVIKKNVKKSKQIRNGQICTALISRTVRVLKR